MVTTLGASRPGKVLTMSVLKGPMDRRNALKLAGGAGLVALVGCSSKKDGSTVAASTPTPTTTASSTAATDADCSAQIPTETAGPFPGDGSNGPDFLHMDGAVRQDITTSLSSGAKAEGVPLTIRLHLLERAKGCTPYSGAAVYLWHASREGAYSMYGNITDQTYLRGVQAAGEDGIVTFKSVFPAAYDGRWPHLHFEIYDSLSGSTLGKQLVTSQLAFPVAICNEVYKTSGYESSVSNLARTSLTSDMVFGDDGGVHQIGTMSGSVASGLTVDLNVVV